MPYNTKEKQKTFSDQWYKNNRDAHKKNAARRRQEHRKKWADFKSGLKCVQCGASHVAILDFHHVIRDRAKQSVNRLVADGRFAAAYREVEKCIPLCANCHRVLHWNETQAKKTRRLQKKKAVGRKKAPEKKLPGGQEVCSAPEGELQRPKQTAILLQDR
jgi:hypothetical protein